MLVNSVGDIGENIGGELDTIVGGTLFLKLFPKNWQEMNIVQGKKKNSGFRSYTL